MYPRTEMSRWLRSCLCANYWNHLSFNRFSNYLFLSKIFTHNLESRMSSMLSSKWHAKFSECKTVSNISVKSLKIRYIFRLFHKCLYLVHEQCLPNMNKKYVGDLKFCSLSKLWELPHDGISKQFISVLHQNNMFTKIGRFRW